MKTEFASPDRADKNQLSTEIQKANELPLVKELTALIPDPFVILNHHRQIVYCNSTLVGLLALEQPDVIYGKRLGEALNCIHAQKTDEGCGTTTACRHCGAVNAMVKSQDSPDQTLEEECRLTTKTDNASFEFTVRAKTMNLSGEWFTLLIVKDISAEKRRYALERIFFHDILNTAGGIQGLVELMEDASDEEIKEYIDLAKLSSETLVEEINAQKEILAAENEELEIEYDSLNALDIIKSVVAIYQNHRAAEGKTIQPETSTSDLKFLSDPRLLIRVIGNMLKNALEAEKQGQTISLGADVKEDHIRFWVRNPSVMTEKIKEQVFQRSFSTKGKGRGLGTYSIKLLGEKYLGGQVGFETNQVQGTCFYIDIAKGVVSD